MYTMRKCHSRCMILTFCALMLLSIGFVLNHKDVWLNLKQRTSFSKGPTPVIVLAYARGGSTFTADIIQQSPDVLYIYEPLFICNWHYSTKDVKFYEHESGAIRYPKEWMNFPSFAKTVISNIFSCEMRKFSKKLLQTLLSFHKTSKDQSFLKNCNKLHSAEECIKSLDKICKTRPVRLIKTVRLRFDVAEELLKTFPNLKILNLIRDPRGIMESRSRGPDAEKPLNFTSASRTPCDQMLYDVLLIRKLQRKYKGRIMTVLYENIATSPIKYLNQIYDFIGITVNKEIENYVYNNTMRGTKSNGYYETRRNNSTETAYHWQKDLKLHQQHLIENACEEFYQKTNFYKIN